jgi:hypothetical protein
VKERERCYREIEGKMSGEREADREREREVLSEIEGKMSGEREADRDIIGTFTVKERERGVIKKIILKKL